MNDVDLINSLKNYYGLEIAKITELALGADMNASVYKAEGNDQKAYFVKVKHGCQCDISVSVIELLQAAGIQQIIGPVKTVYGQSTQLLDGCMLIVYPFIEGQNGFTCTLTADRWVLLGKVLRQVHDINVPLSLQSKIRKESYSAQWRKAVRQLLSQLDVQSPEDEIAFQFVKCMKEKREIVSKLVNCAEELGYQLQNQMSHFVLCHSDIHGGNVFIATDGALYLVDWDEPIMAPKERDLMFIGAAVANVWNQAHEEQLFYEGYGKSQLDTAIITYYRCERIVEDIAHFAKALLFTTTDKKRGVMYQHFIDMFEPQGVVDRACIYM